MDNPIPVPTDNLYKFYALFGLLLAVFSIGAIIYVNNATNALAFSSWVEYEELKQIENPTTAQSARLKSLDKQLEIAQSDKKAFQSALSYALGVSILLVIYGFWKWHTYLQPMQNELLRLQIEKLRMEITESK